MLTLALAAALIAGGAGDAAKAASAASDGGPPMPAWRLRARVVATGMHRAFGVRQVGRFHTGGPFVSNPEFLLQTQPGKMLDPQRVLVALEQNFGAAPGNPAHAAGAVLSLDVDAATDAHALAIPAVLSPGRPAEGGAVQLYSVQAASQLNRVHNAGARTAGFAGVSGPRYLSINNGFGRPWVANAPFGLRGAGSESVLDPDGAPLANAPSDEAGGVFVGASSARTSRPRAVRTGWFAQRWNRQDSGQLTPGAIEHGALGTAFLGSSPDGSGFAVFAVVTGNGAVVQVHVQDGVDGLAPAGTIDVGGTDPGVIGTAFQWVPDRALYVADARRDRIAVIELGDDTRHFTARRTRYLQSPAFRQPVDLAPCVPEIANPRFASHTTLAGGSDLYVVNRGDGSVLRVAQDGTVVARAVVTWPDGREVGGGRLRSVAVSADARRLWLIAERDAGTAGVESVLVEVAGFDAVGTFPGRGAVAASLPRAHETAEDGARLFAAELTLGAGPGTRFNAMACIACHPGPGGASASEAHFARRIAHLDAVSGRAQAPAAAALAPRHALTASGVRAEPLPRDANVVSLRMPLALAAAGRLDEIPDAVIEAQAVSKGDGIKGRVHYVTGADGTPRVGRYGWKADNARLDDIVAQALANEMGVVRPARGEDATVQALAAYLQALATARAPTVAAASAQARGRAAP